MPYSQSKKTSGTEKRLQALKAQLYGKEETAPKVTSSQNTSYTFTAGSSVQTMQTVIQSNTGYLKKDLTKITFLAALIFLAQIALYLSVQYKLITFN